MRSLSALPLLLSLLPMLLLACSLPPSGEPISSSGSAGAASGAGSPTGPAGSTPWPDAAGATSDPGLAALAADFWEEMLRADPVAASNLGDHRYLGLLKDLSPGGLAARRTRLEALSARAAAWDGAATAAGIGAQPPDTQPAPDAASPATQPLSAPDRLTLELLREEIERALIVHDAHFERWLVNPSGAPHIELQNLVEDQPAHTAEERDAMIARWAAMPAFVRQASFALLAGLHEGRVGTRTAIEKTIAQLDALLARSPDEWPLGNPPLDPTVASFTNRTLLEKLRAGLRENLAPALAGYRAVLHDRLLPVARGDEQPGLSSLPGGKELYAQLILAQTGLPLGAQELHDFGRSEVARIRHEMAVLGERVFGAEVAAGAEAGASRDTGEARDDGALREPGASLEAVALREDAIVAAVQHKLRSDPALHFATRDEVQAAAEGALARAAAAVPSAFGLLPPVPCEVVRIAPHEERDTTIAYYREPAADGSRPGRYCINTFAPETRPRYEAEVLAFHESIPGHHLQISIAQELADLPRFRREGGPTAYVEGWALYTERLAEELHLYSGDSDRLGVLSFDAWRACRLVVDTGLHAFGWSRQQAIDYMTANTLLAPNNIENEVDRYIATPAQALAYKVGQREILALRAEAEARLGARFDLPAFHDVVLGSGAVSLPALRRNVEGWIAGR